VANYNLKIALISPLYNFTCLDSSRTLIVTGFIGLTQ